jgi:hypothetical protein
MGWQSPETMKIYLQTMNERKAIRAVLDDEEAQEQQEQDAVNRQREVPPAQTQRPWTAKDHMKEVSPKASVPPADNDELSWYEE